MIDKIGYTKPVTTSRASGVKRSNSADGAAFADALSRAEGTLATDAMDATVATAPIASNLGLLGLQEVSDEETQRRKMVKRGRFTLDALSGLRDALLMGSLPMSTLRTLEKAIAAERSVTADPMLESIMNEIEVRAAVEIAKLEMSGVLGSRE